MARQVRHYDWASTPLGPIDAWSTDLRSAATLVLENAFPAALVWGEDLVTLYNDAFRAILKQKHPAALGRSFADIWREIWHEIGPITERAFAGRSTFIEDQRLIVDRSGQLEEAYFTFSYNPVRGADGSVLGMIDTVVETTDVLRSRAALEESEARFRAFVIAGSDVVYRMSPDWRQLRQLDGRKSFVDTLQSPEDWMEHYIHPGDRQDIRSAIDRAIATRSIFELEHRIRRDDDTYVWITSRAVPILDDRGAIREWLGTASDVTARRLAEATTRENDRHQAFLIELNDALRSLADPVDIQSTASRLLGEQLGSGRAYYVEVDRTTGEYVVARDWHRPGETSHARRYGLDSWPMPSLSNGRTWVVPDVNTEPALADEQRDAYRRNGIGAMIVVPLVKNGRLVATCLTNQRARRDWTFAEVRLVEETAERTWAAVERARAETELRKSEARLSAAFESVPVGVAAIGAFGQSIISNAQYRRFLPTGIVPSRDPSRVDRWQAWDASGQRLSPCDFPAARALRGESVVPGQEMLYTDDDGRQVWASVSTVPTRDESGSVTGAVATINDIDTAKRNADRLREREEQHRRDLERQVREATDELKISRDFLRAALDASTDMIQIFEAVRDDTGRIVDFSWVLNNQTSASRYGEVHGDSLLKMNPGVIVEGIFDAFERVTETGTPEQGEHHYTHEQFDGWFYQSIVKLNDGVATTTKDITDWKNVQAEILRLQEEAAQARIRKSEERFRSFADNSTDALWILDARAHMLEYLSPAFDRIWGETRDCVLHDLERWNELIHPDDREHASKALPLALAGESVQIVYRIVRPDTHEVRWIQDTGFPILDASGAISHVGGISKDVTSERETAQRLQENQRRLWTVIQGIPQLVWRAVGRGEWTWASQQWTDYTGQTQEEAHDFGWLETLHPDDRERAVLDWAQSDGSSSIDIDARLFHAGEQRYRWFQMRALPVRDEDGTIVEWLGTSTDVDDMRQLQERQQVLVAELQHRTRNLLGVVKSMADRTAQSAVLVGDFLPRYRERLSALSRINGLLSKLEMGERVTFDEMIRTELGARGVLENREANRVVLEGPTGVRLRSATVQTFALAIHELTTNAVKYGALAGGHGRLHVRWQTQRDAAGKHRLHVDWIESGVLDMPEPNAAPHGGGYGRTLIERALPYQLQAQTTYEFRDDGVHCTIDLPLG